MSDWYRDTVLLAVVKGYDEGIYYILELVVSLSTSMTYQQFSGCFLNINSNHQFEFPDKIELFNSDSCGSSGFHY